MDLTVLASAEAILFYALFVIGIYLYLEWKFGYWKRKGVPHVPPSSFFYGNVKDIFWGKKNTAIFAEELCKQFPGQPYIGYYEFHNPVLIVRDLDYIKMVLTEKFNSFHEQKFYIHEKNDILFALNPFIRKGDKWKEMRSIIAPGVTANRVKANPDLILKPYKELCNCIDNQTGDIELTLLVKRIICNTVASWGWGIEGGGFAEKKSVVHDIFDKILMTTFQFNVIVHCRLAAYLLKYRFFSKEQTEFFINITKQGLRNIEERKITSPSLLQVIHQTRTKNGEDIQNEKTIRTIAANIATFYLDGYETTARALSYILYNLMLYPDVQSKLKAEIMNLKEDLTVSNTEKLEYLNMVISEVLRKIPAVPYLGRTCTERCSLGSLVIDPGTFIIIPTLAVHMDPDIYPDPFQFDPERFSEEHRKTRHPYSHMPFGQGPRICLGMKFAMAEIKLIVAMLLRDYELLPALENEVKPIMINNSESFFFLPEHSLYVRFKKINK